jgi:hypothetical protein
LTALALATCTKPAANAMLVTNILDVAILVREKTIVG